MSKGTSKLNPYAAAYVPISKRVDGVAKSFHSITSKAFGGSNFQNTAEIQMDVMSGFYDSRSQEYSQVARDTQIEMDLAYLQSLFPSISEQTLIEVYSVSDFDLEAAHDMLNQLEHFDLESPQNLPDSLDIGDVSEPQILPEFSNLKLKDAAAWQV